MRGSIIKKLQFFRILSDGDECQGIQPESKATDYSFRNKPERQSKNWQSQPYYIHNPLLKKTDFHPFLPYLYGIGQQSLDRMDFELGSLVELLPIQVEDRGEEPFFLFNPVNFVDCLDLERTEKAKAGFIEKYAFRTDCFPGPSLFQISSGQTGLFCVTGFDDDTNDFYAAYHKANMRGLKFELVAEEAYV